MVRTVQRIADDLYAWLAPQREVLSASAVEAIELLLHELNGIESGYGAPSMTNEQKWRIADELRARIIVEGYPLPDQSHSKNEHLRTALVQGTRREQLRDLVKMSDTELDARLTDLFPERFPPATQ